MLITEITEMRFGTTTISVKENAGKIDNASIMKASYINPNHLDGTNPSIELETGEEIFIGGIPLSLSFTSTSLISPSPFYSLNIIEVDFIQDNLGTLNINNPPHSKTFILGDTHLSSTQFLNKYYMDIEILNSSISEIKEIFGFNGFPMAKGPNNELILNKTSNNFDEIDEFVDMFVGGTPLTVGRIRNKYYLIVKTTLNPSEF